MKQGSSSKDKMGKGVVVINDAHREDKEKKER